MLLLRTAELRGARGRTSESEGLQFPTGNNGKRRLFKIVFIYLNFLSFFNLSISLPPRSFLAISSSPNTFCPFPNRYTEAGSCSVLMHGLLPPVDYSAARRAKPRFATFGVGTAAHARTTNSTATVGIWQRWGLGW